MPKKTKPKLDDKDIAIIVKLSENAQATNAAIARDLSVSEETIRRRVRRLVTEGYVDFNITIDPRVFGFAESAVLTLKPTRSKDIEVINFAREQVGVTNAYRVLESDGVNVVCEVSCVDVNDLNGLLDLIMMNEAIESFRMQRIFDPEYTTLGYPGIR